MQATSDNSLASQTFFSTGSYRFHCKRLRKYAMSAYTESNNGLCQVWTVRLVIIVTEESLEGCQ